MAVLALLHLPSWFQLPSGRGAASFTGSGNQCPKLSMVSPWSTLYKEGGDPALLPGQLLAGTELECGARNRGLVFCPVPLTSCATSIVPISNSAAGGLGVQEKRGKVKSMAPEDH